MFNGVLLEKQREMKCWVLELIHGFFKDCLEFEISNSVMIDKKIEGFTTLLGQVNRDF